MDITPDQCRGARGLLDITQSELATKSGVSLGTVINFESGERQPIRAVMEAIRKALEDAGIEFIPEDGGGLGVRFAQRQKGSKRS
jgi:transcriptional regulator with XRE-family HTH domain